MTTKMIASACVVSLLLTGCFATSPEPSDNRSSSMDKKVERKTDQIIDRTTDRAVNKVGNTLESKVDEIFNRLF